MRIVIFGFLLIVIMSCGSSEKANKHKGFSSSLDSKKFWYQKDWFLDKVPGISLEKWNKENKKSFKSSIIVAVLDTQIDTNHEDLKSQIWVNEKEIPNNGVDDDTNGYIDDVNGWNFVGKKNKGYLVWGNFEYVRIIRKWENYFKNKNESEFSGNDLINYNEFKRALSHLDYYKDYYENWNKSLKFEIDVYPVAKDSLRRFFPKENYTIKELDSLYKIYKINDKSFQERRDDNDRDLGALIDYMMVSFENDEKSVDDIIKVQVQMDSILQKNLNTAYNEREFIGDNQKILEKGYGNNNVSSYKKIQKHSTEVSGIIAANRNNKIGIQGFSNNIKIMPLSISISGDEHDKDIAMGIYYAVDNGAKVINMSFSKEFSLSKDWVFEAMKYAEQHNVLIVHCSGNNSYDIDTNPKYPNDNGYTNTSEVSQNFINVGSTSQRLDSTFVSTFSNYGKENVDLFAPGEEIYTTILDNKYDYDSGTSLSAPMVSGTAALIWLYYPNLSVQEVKKIILESGTSYDIEVLVPGGEGKKAPVSELSKSGKVLNVYNAMEMAKKMSKLK